MSQAISKTQDAVLLVIFACFSLFAASAARADEPEIPVTVHGSVMARAFPEDSTFQQIVFRGEVASYMYDALSAVDALTVTRGDGTTYLVRHSAAMSCSRSDRFSIPHFACVSFVAADGTSALGAIDPEYGGVARIGVGN